MAHPKPITRAEKIVAAKQFVSGVRLPAISFVKSARDLSWTQARDTLYALANMQYFQFDHSVYDQFTATRAADGSVAVTPPAEPRAGFGSSTDHTRRFTIRPGVVRGIQFRVIHEDVKFWTTGNIARSSPRTNLPPLDPRLLVLVAWLCEMLSSRWGVTRLYDMGFLGNAAHSANNSHNWGRAIDFAGAGGANGSGEFDVNIMKHWGLRPITMPVDWGPINPKTKKHQFQKGQKYPQWPADFRDTTYRLESSSDSPQVNGQAVASDLFRDVYHLGAVEGTDTGNTSNSPTKIGRNSKFILHPDYPDVRKRTSHKEHIHIQVGPTEHVGFWKS